MPIGIWVLGDQLHSAQAALAAADRTRVRVLLVESTSVLNQRAYHRQKLVLVWSAMRHFAESLRRDGWCVDHQESETFTDAVRLDERARRGSAVAHGAC